jgi:hypothetical protein
LCYNSVIRKKYMTLIAIYKEDKCVGRCDARCYNAKGEDCHCICQGTNHGKGFDIARANTDANGQKLADEYVKDNPDKVVKVV